MGKPTNFESVDNKRMHNLGKPTYFYSVDNNFFKIILIHVPFIYRIIKELMLIHISSRSNI